MKKILSIILLVSSPLGLAESTAKPILNSGLGFAPTITTGVEKFKFPVHSLIKSIKENENRVVNIELHQVWSEELKTDVVAAKGSFYYYADSTTLEFPEEIEAAKDGKVKTLQVINAELQSLDKVLEGRNGQCSVRVQSSYSDTNTTKPKISISITGKNSLLEKKTLQSGIISGYSMGPATISQNDFKNIYLCIQDALLKGGLYGTFEIPAVLTLRDKAEELKILDGEEEYRLPSTEKKSVNKAVPQ